MSLQIPKHYEPTLTVRQTLKAVKIIKDVFEVELAKELNLDRVSAPLFVKSSSGLNDNLNGVERPVSFLFEGETVEIAVPQSVVAGAPVYSVYSAKMDVKIDSFAPNKTGYSCSNDAKDALNTVSSSINAEKTNVTLYCEMQKNGNGFTILTDPYVTLKLTNKAAAGEVKVQFSGSTTRMYEAARGTENTAYTWSASTGDTCTRYIGRYQQSRTCSNAVVEPAGTMTAGEITITWNSITFTMAIDTITINNPSA